MRSLLPILILLSVPLQAQTRVFRASSIDMEQDSRLDKLDHQIKMLSTSVERLESKVERLENPVVKTTPKPVQVKPSTVVTVEPTKPYAVITIESLPGCRDCDQWKAKEAVELRSQGWTVIEAPLTSSTEAPFFRVCIGDRCFAHRGFMSHGVLRGILSRAFNGNVQPTRSSKSSWYSTSELRAMIRAKRPGGWRGPVYADVSPRSSVKQHLVGPEHGFSWQQVNGLTQEEALILHDLAPRHGNQIFPTHR